MDVGRPAGGFDLGLGRVQAGVEQVGADGVVEQVRFLRHHADLRGQRVERHVAQVVPVDQDAPAGGVVQARDQIGQGGLARAAGPDQRHQLARVARGRRCLPARLRAPG